MRKEITDFIYRRFPYDNHWLNGNCYYFAVILKDRFPEGKIVYDVIRGHFLFELDYTLYDWHGVYERLPHESTRFIDWDKFDEYDSLQKQRIIRDCIF